MFTEEIKCFQEYTGQIQPNHALFMFYIFVCIYIYMNILNDIPFTKICCGNAAPENFLHHLLSVVPHHLYTRCTCILM